MVDAVTEQGLQEIPAAEAAAQSRPETAANGVHYATFGDLSGILGKGPNVSVTAELKRLINAVPLAMSAALDKTVFYFVPLALTLTGEAESAEQKKSSPTSVATTYSPKLADRAICHKNVKLEGHEGVFLSSRLHGDAFALAFELFINVAHGVVDVTGVPSGFASLVWGQTEVGARGETSYDAFESREKARRGGVVDEKAKSEFLEAAFVDALAIYMLSLYLDFEYADLKEREYPLLTPRELGDRLRSVNALFPPNPGYEFLIKYKRR